MKKDNSEKERKTYIKNIEKLTRYCSEYSKWADDLRNKCSNCAMCNRPNDGLVDFQIHHDPTLFELVDHSIVELNELTLDVASKIMKLHLDNKVSVKVICLCCHQREHNLRKNV